MSNNGETNMSDRGCRLMPQEKPFSVDRSGELTALLRDPKEMGLLGECPVPRSEDTEALAKALQLLEEACQKQITRLRAAAPTPDKKLLSRREAIRTINLLKRQLTNIRHLDIDLGEALILCKELEHVPYKGFTLQIPDVEEA